MASFSRPADAVRAALEMRDAGEYRSARPGTLRGVGDPHLVYRLAS